MEQNNGAMSPITEESKGPTIGIVIIVLILLIGGIYIFTSREETSSINEENPVAEELLNQSNSTEVTDIEADALNTDLESLDTELQDIETELNQTN